MTEHPYTLAQETVVISAFRNGVSVHLIAEVIGKTPASVEKLLKKNRTQNEARGDDEGAEPSETNVPQTQSHLHHAASVDLIRSVTATVRKLGTRHRFIGRSR